ncbi:caspase Nc-like [Tropilaelaps mercedesae]|uniref:Caspase Nc-like n=1 Tax=Tropilaelaps mercedesae TaxID=418985 RepID=A0A1V9XWG8_9ACAR|nr:caspase Nc-like [Tropilaelaps mercedesae]
MVHFGRKFEDSRQKRRLLRLLCQAADRTIQQVACCCVCCGTRARGSNGRGDECRPGGGSPAISVHSHSSTMSLSHSWQCVEGDAELLRELADKIEDFRDLVAALQSAGLLSAGDNTPDDGVDTTDYATEDVIEVPPSPCVGPEKRLKALLGRIQIKDEESFRRFKRTLIENGEFNAVGVLQPLCDQSVSPPTSPLPIDFLPDSEAVTSRGTNETPVTPGMSQRGCLNDKRDAAVKTMNNNRIRRMLNKIISLDEDSFDLFRQRTRLDHGRYDAIQVLGDALRSLQEYSETPFLLPTLPRYLTPRISRQNAARGEFMREEVDARAAPMVAMASTSAEATDEVRIRAAEVAVEGGPHVYSMLGHPRGLCVIFNIRHFPSVPDKDRPGSDADQNYMIKLFEAFGFTVYTHVDRSSDQILELLETYACDNVQESHDAFVCIIMSHGEQQHIYGSDYNTVKLQTVFEMFNNTKCPRLRERPKIFLIQACRGYLPDNGTSGRQDAISSGLDDLSVSMADVSVNVGAKKTELYRDQSDAGIIPKTLPRPTSASQTTEASRLGQAAAAERRIPSWSDMYIAYAVIENYESLRDFRTGSWFLKAVYEVMARESWENDLDTLMDRVIKNVLERSSFDGQRQCPEIRKIGWHKKLFFNTGL